jgi:hypothetical protein
VAPVVWSPILAEFGILPPGPFHGTLCNLSVLPDVFVTKDTFCPWRLATQLHRLQKAAPAKAVTASMATTALIFSSDFLLVGFVLRYDADVISHPYSTVFNVPMIAECQSAHNITMRIYRIIFMNSKNASCLYRN